MYELGFALAAGKDVVIISGPNTEKYPFDIQHGGILSYAVGSKSDFTELEKKLTEKLTAHLKLQEIDNQNRGSITRKGERWASAARIHRACPIVGE